MHLTGNKTKSNGLNRQIQIYISGRYLNKRPAFPISPDELRVQALKTLEQKVFDYIAGGAGAERSIRYNKQGFERWRILPKMLTDVESADISTCIFGEQMLAPILLAPIGVQSIIHKDAELATTKAAAALGLTMICSTVSSQPMEVIGQSRGACTNWFQLYWPSDDELTLSLIKRAEKAGFGAIVITLDTFLLAWRERDLKNAYLPFFHHEGITNYLSDPVFQRLLAEQTNGKSSDEVKLWGRLFSNPSITWQHLQMVQDATSLPIILKGILRPEDAVMARKHGIDGVIVSNHGGRQVDGCVAAIDMLEEVVRAVGNDYPVLYDSGIRRGADVFIALALGAKAVLLGRPYAYGLGLDGERGVTNVLRNLIADFDLTMALSGCKNVSQITRDYIVRV